MLGNTSYAHCSRPNLPQVLALALHMRTTPFDGVGGGRTGNFAGSPGAALASYVHLHGPMYGPDGRPTTALPTGLDDEVLQPILKLLLETGVRRRVLAGSQR